MKTRIQIAAACAIVLIGFAAPVLADEFGDKIANVLCYGTASYRLSPQEEAAWNEAHTGTFSGASPGVTYTFSKSAGTASGQCTWRKSVPPESATARVTKSGSNLIRTNYAKAAIE